MSNPTVDDFLNTPLGAVEKPPILPAGTYMGTIVKHRVDKRRREVNGQQVEVPFVDLQVKVTNADEDVDPELLAKVDLSTQYVYPAWDIDPKGKYALQQFLVGFFEGAGDGKIGEFLPLLVGKQVVFLITHTIGKKPDANGELPLYVNVTKVKAAE